jgi:ATP-dependent DNA ligase
LKIKPHDDAEATVIGYTSGRETDKGSKLLGLMGALIVEFNGKRMELSGFTDQERQFSSAEAASFAASNPGSECPDWITNTNFPRGSQVTFKYRGLTKEGIPQEARYFRKA